MKTTLSKYRNGGGVCDHKELLLFLSGTETALSNPSPSSDHITNLLCFKILSLL